MNLSYSTSILEGIAKKKECDGTKKSTSNSTDEKEISRKAENIENLEERREKPQWHHNL